MFENAKSDSKIIVHLNLKEETDRSEAVESAHATEKKPLMQKQPSSAVVWSIVVGSAILVSVTFLLLIRQWGLWKKDGSTNLSIDAPAALCQRAELCLGSEFL